MTTSTQYRLTDQQVFMFDNMFRLFDKDVEAEQGQTITRWISELSEGVDVSVYFNQKKIILLRLKLTKRKLSINGIPSKVDQDLQLYNELIEQLLVLDQEQQKIDTQLLEEKKAYLIAKRSRDAAKLLTQSSTLPIE